MAQQPKPQRQIRLEIPANLSATYANAVVISQTHSEIILDFTQVMPNDPRARVQSRIAMTPANAKSLLLALQKNLEHFETRHGPISMPPRATSLADQLFGSIKPEGESDEEDEEGNE